MVPVATPGGETLLVVGRVKRKWLVNPGIDTRGVDWTKATEEWRDLPCIMKVSDIKARPFTLLDPKTS